MNAPLPYEQTHRLRQLLLVATIVEEGQAQSIIALNNENEVAICFTCYARGTAPSEVLSLIGGKKDVVFSVMRADKWPIYKAQLKERFSVSKLSKGIAFCVPIDSVAGVSIYKMLSNTRLFEKPTRKGKAKKEKAR